jgi:phosphoglycolate phosphatase
MPMTLPYHTILFDLDGTLTDPKEGITKSIIYALDKMGIDIPPMDTLTSFIGPPLPQSFKAQFQLSDEEVQQAMTYYRDRFSDVGLYENIVFDGIEEMLSSMKKNGYTLAVATSKPTVFAKKILDHFNLSQYFNVIVGSELDGTRSLKGEVIQEVLKQLGTKELAKTIMIGDRKHDLIGAKENGIDSIGVTYGYGSQAELEEAEATYIVHTVTSFSIIFGKKASFI